MLNIILDIRERKKERLAREMREAREESLKFLILRKKRVFFNPIESRLEEEAYEGLETSFRTSEKY